jgi:hypothetical protein
MKAKIKGRTYKVASLEEAAAKFRQVRDAEVQAGRGGASRMRDGEVFDDAGKAIARISYNGRVWAPGPWTSGAEPLI